MIGHPDPDSGKMLLSDILPEIIKWLENYSAVRTYPHPTTTWPFYVGIDTCGFSVGLAHNPPSNPPSHFIWMNHEHHVLHIFAFAEHFIHSRGADTGAVEGKNCGLAMSSWQCTGRLFVALLSRRRMVRHYLQQQ